MLPGAKSCLDCTYAGPEPAEYSYNLCSACGSVNSLSSFLIWHCDNTYYSTECSSSTNIHGCIGLKRKNYCILNTQYSKEEYFKLMPKIIEHMNKTGEWGQGLDPSVCGFGYNESVAQDYFPLTGDTATAAGYRWSTEIEQRNLKYLENLAKPQPELDDLSDAEILKQTLFCRATGAPFRLTQAELIFYRKHQLPLPQFSPTQRHRQRVAQTHNFRLNPTKCARSGKKTWSIYPSDVEHEIFAEDEWLKHTR
jgi:hypothetical protein